jgi:hypothetical protein
MKGKQFEKKEFLFICDTVMEKNAEEKVGISMVSDILFTFF